MIKIKNYCLNMFAKYYYVYLLEKYYQTRVTSADRELFGGFPNDPFDVVGVLRMLSIYKAHFTFLCFLRHAYNVGSKTKNVLV